MPLVDLYVLFLPIVGILVACDGVTFLTVFAGVASLAFLLGRGRRPSPRGSGRDDLDSVFLFVLELSMIAVGISSRGASLIPPPDYRSGILWRGSVRPAL